MYNRKKIKLKVFRWAALVGFAASFMLPIAAHAHSMYIQSSRYNVDLGKESPLFFCYGHRVPVDDGIRGKKLKSVMVHTPTNGIKTIQVRDETSLQSYMVKYDHSGTYVLTAETNPGFYTVYIDKKGRERHATKPIKAVKENAAEIKKSFFSKQYTKTYVVCGEASKKFPAKVGLDVELVPLSDITKLKEGDTLKLQVHHNGKPYNGEGQWDATYNGFSTQPEDMFIQKQKVNNGLIVMPIERAGRWFVRFSLKTPAPEKDREKYLQAKQTSTIVFEIANKRISPKNGGR